MVWRRIFSRTVFYFAVCLVLLFCFNRVSAAQANDTLNQVYQCGTLDSPGTYTMNQSIIPSGSIASCINVTNQNVTLNCAGFWISNLSVVAAGVYSNQINTTVKNCNITMGNASSGGIGVSFVEANNSFILNSTFYLAYTGISLSNSHNNLIANITTNSDRFFGIYLKSGSGSNVISDVVARSSYDGIWLTASSNNILQNILSESNSQIGIYLSSSSNNNTLFNVTPTLSINTGLSILNSANNRIINSSISSNVEYGISLVGCSNTSFQNTKANSNRYGISVSSSNQTNFSSVNSNYNWYALYYSNTSNLSFVENNFFKDNLYAVFFNTTLVDETLERVYPAGSNISFNFSIVYPNGTEASNFIYNITSYPTSPLFVTNISNNFTVSFNTSKEGVYSIKINVTLADLNVPEIRSFIFLVGNTSSSSIRYYMHADGSTHGQPLAKTVYDSGSMYTYPTTSEEERHCATWVQFQPDEIVNFLPIIKNISIGWFYNSSDYAIPRIERYSEYSSRGDYAVTLSPSSAYILNVSNFTNLNITSDYPWRFYWVGLKLTGGYPSVKSNATQQSYADFTYLYSGPQITHFGENTGSDIRNARILSSTFADSEKKTSTIQLDGEGNFTMVFNLTSANYSVKYDGILCPSQNCTVNSNSGGLINVTFYLGSEHTLSLIENATPPSVTINSPANTEYTTASVIFNLTVTDSATIDTCKYSLDSGVTNTTITNITSSEWSASLTLAEGSYIVNFYCNDTFGNLNNSESRSFSINLPDATDSGSSGSLPSFTVTEASLEQGYEKQMREGFKITFSAGDGKNEKHSLVVKGVSKDSTTITISSEPITLTLKVNETKKLDLDNNGFYDLEVSLKEIKGYFANIGLKTIKEKIIGEKVDENGEEIPENESISTEEDKKEINWPVILLSVFVIVVAVVCLALVLRHRKKKRRLRGY